MVQARKDKNAKEEYTTFMLVNRILAVNFLSTYSNTTTLVNAVFDLISLPEATFNETISGIRDEVNAVIKEEGGWSQRIAYKLPLTDSFLRESMRSNPIGETGLERIVTGENGYTFSNGLHIPKGATVSAPLYGIHHDEDVYRALRPQTMAKEGFRRQH